MPRTYEELLDPQWKGKLAWRIGSASGAALFLTNLRLAWGEEKAQAYFLKLREQKIVNFGSGSARTLVDRVVAGEYPIALSVRKLAIRLARCVSNATPEQLSLAREGWQTWAESRNSSAV